MGVIRSKKQYVQLVYQMHLCFNLFWNPFWLDKSNEEGNQSVVPMQYSFHPAMQGPPITCPCSCLPGAIPPIAAHELRLSCWYWWMEGKPVQLVGMEVANVVRACQLELAGIFSWEATGAYWYHFNGIHLGSCGGKKTPPVSKTERTSTEALRARNRNGRASPTFQPLLAKKRRSWLQTSPDGLWHHFLLAILCDLFGMVKWPFKWLSDLQIGDQKVTFNHLVVVFWNVQPYFFERVLWIWSISCWRWIETVVKPPAHFAWCELKPSCWRPGQGWQVMEALRPLKDRWLWTNWIIVHFNPILFHESVQDRVITMWYW